MNIDLPRPLSYTTINPQSYTTINPQCIVDKSPQSPTRNKIIYFNIFCVIFVILICFAIAIISIYMKYKYLRI